MLGPSPSMLTTPLTMPGTSPKRVRAAPLSLTHLEILPPFDSVHPATHPLGRTCTTQTVKRQASVLGGCCHGHLTPHPLPHSLI
mmetsp:Transcript_142285/g.248096  ORF Transcript_142285/g.248096 Transcript_142285/m.248096 type:complete len:84 (-) Transcript_142285:120-371(-)